MADPDSFYDPRSDNYNRGRSFQQSRPLYRGRGRGRGRGDYYVQRALNELGVSDLREHLNRKHQQENSRNGPPSDPSYSFLRDRMREDYDSSSRGANLHHSNSFTSRRGRLRGKTQEQTFIENPMNIKIELSTSTGQRNYSVEDSTIPNIKHIPDYSEITNTRSRRGGIIRARGRIRYNTDQDRQVRAKSTDRKYEERLETSGSQLRSRSVESQSRGNNYRSRRGNYRGRLREDVDNYDTRAKSTERKYENRENQVRSKSIETRDETSVRGNNYRARGSYRGRPREEVDNYEFRGRERGRGRGRGNRRGRGGQQYVTPLSVASNDVVTEENWDNEEQSTEIDKNDSFESEECSEEQKEKNKSDPEEQHDKGNSDEEKVNIEENLVVTSSSDGKTKKRTVRFKDDENKDDEEIEETEE